MDRLNVSNMIIEITRECNLMCEHCLRGEQEIGVIKTEYLKELFSQIENIHILTLSGGEPALYPEKIKEVISIARLYNTDIENFYIATNGTIASNEFIKSIMDLWLYCSDNEISGVDISNDSFHEYEWNENYERLSILKFVHKKFKEDGYDYRKYEDVMAEGRGTNWSNRKNTNISIQDIKEGYYELSDIEFYLNCEGNIISGCNWSYESQKDPKNILCHVSDFDAVYNDLLMSVEKVN